jgi:threonine/homoserine/homoserine lactone efflux protein
MPSAGVALVVTRSAGAGTRHGVLVAAGIVLADLSFVAMALLGMTLVAEVMGGFFSAIRVLAGLYLIWFGITLLRKPKVAAPETAPQETRGSPSLLVSFLSGLLLTFGDVKAIIFYASLFPALFDLRSFTGWEIAAIGAITIVTVGGTKLLYALFARRLALRLQHRHRGLAEKARPAAGVCMIGAGAWVITKP